MIFKAPEKNAILKSGYGINSTFFQYIHPWSNGKDSREFRGVKGFVYLAETDIASSQTNSSFTLTLSTEHFCAIHPTTIVCL